MSLFKQKQIYVSAHETEAWNDIKGCHKVRIVTLVFELKLLKFHFLKVKQFIPLITNPFYDGEFSSNRSVKAAAVEEKAKAYEWIYTRKQKQAIK